MQIAPPLLDMNKEVQTFELAAADLPPTNQLRIRFEELSSLPKGARMKGGGDVFPLSKRDDAIEFADLPGAALELRFLRPAAGKPALRVTPVFHEADNPLFRSLGNEWPLTFERLEKYRKTLENLLEKNREALPAVQGEVEA